jgi:dipeptidyl aminopeptidase/acylaminoacyl peptidase
MSLTFHIGIDGEWGGRAFTDLTNLLDVLEERPYLDQSKAVLAGASYSGYLVSWFFGHDVAKKVIIPRRSASPSRYAG